MSSIQQKAVIYCRVSSQKQVTKGDGLGPKKHVAVNMPAIKIIRSLKFFVMRAYRAA